METEGENWRGGGESEMESEREGMITEGWCELKTKVGTEQLNKGLRGKLWKLLPLWGFLGKILCKNKE